MNSIEKKGLFLVTIILFSIVIGFIIWNVKGKPIFEGAETIGSVSPIIAQEDPVIPTPPIQYSYQFAYIAETQTILGVVYSSGNVIDYSNNIIGTSDQISGNVLDLQGKVIGKLISVSEADGLFVVDRLNSIVGNVMNGQIVNYGLIVGTFNDNGEIVDSDGAVVAFSQTIALSSTRPTGVVPRSTGDIRNQQSTPTQNYETVTNQPNAPTDPEYEKTDNISSFNYDSLYNTDNLTPKYSFVNSSFMYKSTLLDENDYLNKVYFENNPLEVDSMCRNLDSTTCGLTSACVYVGNNACVPGGKTGPHTTYRDVNVDYYYYKGKCYGNCPGNLDSVIVTTNSAISTPTNPIQTTPSA